MDPQLALETVRADYERRLEDAAREREARSAQRARRAARRRVASGDHVERTTYLVILGNTRIA
ncbi:hypothetical protein ET495_01445 [Xylanimonas allomyrinae]|uniref:Uncharacterized protein n=1 Tax=Xylanimonas allomyrinae TaxID=2509459 RepID=A0A4P6EHY2_9MICO|nr:hypothetical protein [Xylanimonas allomyrinae]QAY62160.1 hypothetical protein ET495_01445 [Xylanimonas allomyrinae]